MYLDTQEISQLIGETASKLGYSRAIPFSWNYRRSGTMGLAFNERIELSHRLFLRATPEQRRETIVHEVCHVVARSMRDMFPRYRPHGYQWRGFMAKAGYPDAKRCHKVNCEGLQGDRKKFPAFCGCGPHPLSSCRYRRTTQGTVYRCAFCKCRITLAPQGTAAQNVPLPSQLSQILGIPS